ncbi:MAG: glycosyltransferase family 2 protein [Candidatus Bipolaricaulota bacterium]
MESSVVLAIPVYNEGARVGAVLEAARGHVTGPVLVVDDGSTDDTADVVAGHPVEVVHHDGNRGYGAALRTAFRWAAERRIDWCITMDADRQHEPACIPRFLERLRPAVDIVSGSRYLDAGLARDEPPGDRRWVNQVVTELVRAVTGYPITDAFCGFRAYRVTVIERLALQDPGYALPVELWIKAAHCGLRVEEVSVPLIYHDYGKGVGARPPRERLAQYLSVAAEVLRWTCSS